jgi:PPOX class probable F420-dependent enzyme
MEMPSQLIRLFVDGTAIGHLATSRDDVPHVTPVWLDYDGTADTILIDVGMETVKRGHVRANPHVCLSLVAPHNATMWAVVTGVITEIHDDSGPEHVQRLAHRYLGRPKRNPGRRAVLHLKPTRVSWWGDGP